MNTTLWKIKSNLLDKWWFDQQNKSIFENIIWLPLTISDKLPFPLSKYFIKLIDNLGLVFFRFLHLFSLKFSSYYLIEGNEKQSTKKIRILYNGNPKSLGFIIKRFYTKSYQIKKISKNQGKKTRNQKNNYKQQPDAIITKSDMFYRAYFQSKGYIAIPEHVTFLLNTTRSLEQIINGVHSDIRKDIKKAQNTKYTFEVRDDVKSFDLFYFQMYLPYAQWKHKKSDRIATYATIRHLQAQGAELLLIKHKEEYIFGGIFQKEKNIMKTYYAGLKNKKFSHLHNGIMALSYYYLILISKKKNCKYIDFGTAKPFRDDGLYQYKNKWNMKIVQSSPYSSDLFAIKIYKNKSIFDNFITHHPVHYFNNEKIRLLKKEC